MSTAVTVMMLGMGSFSLLSFVLSSGIVALVNEEILKADYLDFLLIGGWGKPKKTEDAVDSDTTSESTKPLYSSPTSENCIDKGFTECSLYINQSPRDYEKINACLSVSRTDCLAGGGSWTSTDDTKDCNRSVIKSCILDKGTNKYQKCVDKTKLSCMKNGGIWVSTSKSTDGSVMYKS